MTVTTPSDQETWGIIRYMRPAAAEHSPRTTRAAFDGWYTDRNDALAVARDWVTRHPHWIVALVRSDLVWFGDRPLTKREHERYRE
jgi:hypothetical protein